MATLWRDLDGAWRTALRGRQVLADARINKGTAFSDGERRVLGLTGLIPAAHFTLEDQAGLFTRSTGASPTTWPATSPSTRCTTATRSCSTGC